MSQMCGPSSAASVHSSRHAYQNKSSWRRSNSSRCAESSRRFEAHDDFSLVFFVIVAIFVLTVYHLLGGHSEQIGDARNRGAPDGELKADARARAQPYPDGRRRASAVPPRRSLPPRGPSPRRRACLCRRPCGLPANCARPPPLLVIASPRPPPLPPPLTHTHNTHTSSRW